MSRFFRLFICAAVILIAEAAAARQDSPPPADTRAREVLEAARRHLAGATSVSSTIVQHHSITGTNLKQQMQSTYDFALQPPRKIAVILKEGPIGETVVCDGEHLYSFSPTQQWYSKTDAPRDVRDLFSDLSGAALGMGGGPLSMIGPLLFAPSLGNEHSPVTQLRYIGLEDLDGRSCHHLLVTATPEEFDPEADELEGEELFNVELSFDVWIDAGEQPVVRQTRIELTEIMRKLAAQSNPQAPPLNDLKAELSTVFSDWRLNQEISAAQFTFAPPAGAKYVDEMSEEEEDEVAEGADDFAGRPHALLNQPAPDFELELLDGGKVKLSQHKGKNVVILDFWATWCGPCIKAMPELMHTAEAYRGKDVVFYAVNGGEEAAKIRAFLEKKQWKLPVALDADSKVWGMYRVPPVPQTFIIDKNGVVRHVHIGFSANVKPPLRDRLAREIDALLK